jgi:hypothetical protein
MLVDFHKVFCAQFVPGIKTRRGRNKWAERNRLPVIQSGRTVLIDLETGIARLRELERFQEPARRRRKLALDPVTAEPKQTPGKGTPAARRPARTARQREVLVDA